MTTGASPSTGPTGALISKATRLRSLLLSPELTFLMEAHDGLSAKIVEEAGFPAIWASGLTVSAALGVRDSNEASWTQVLEVLEFMADATSVPILLDGDTGYGNFNNVRRLVRKLCQRGVAAVCLEDKLFPKTNSFIGDHQPKACEQRDHVYREGHEEAVAPAPIQKIRRRQRCVQQQVKRARYHEADGRAQLSHHRVPAALLGRRGERKQ